jgi:hypothetical protein
MDKAKHLAIRELSETLFSFYTNLMESGFSNNQAFTITLTWMTAQSAEASSCNRNVMDIPTPEEDDSVDHPGLKPNG